MRDLAYILRVSDWAFVTVNVTVRLKWRPFVNAENHGKHKYAWRIAYRNPRVFLAACLGKDSIDRLLDFNLKAKSRRNDFDSLTDFWLEKWVSSRVKRADVIEKVSNESFEKVTGSLRPQSYEKQYKLI